MISVKDAGSPNKLGTPRHPNLIQAEKQEMFAFETFDIKTSSRIQIEVNEYYKYTLPKDCVEPEGMLGIIFLKNKEAVTKSKIIKVSIDHRLIGAFENYLNYINETRPFVKDYSKKEAARCIAELCRFGVHIKKALNFVVPNGMKSEGYDEILEIIVKGMTPVLVSTIMLFDDKSECKKLLVPILMRTPDDGMVISKLKLWLEMSIGRSRHCTVGFTGDTSMQETFGNTKEEEKRGKKLSHLTYKTEKARRPLVDTVIDRPKKMSVVTSVKWAKKKYVIPENQALEVLQGFIRGYLVRKDYGIENVIKRKECIQELVDTEQNLHDNMVLMENYFRQPLLESIGGNKGIEKQINAVFLTLPRCIKSSKIFVEKLKQSLEKYKVDTCIGDTLKMLLPHVAPYLNFTTDYQIALSTWKRLKKEPKVSMLLKENLKLKELESQTLESLLIQPVQRVMRYPMLIKEIIKLTKRSHPDYFQLKEAFNEFHFFSTIANERSKMRDSLQEVVKEIGDEDLLKDNRYHLWTGNVIAKTPTRVYLFNDMIMICIKNKNKWITQETLKIGGDVEVFTAEKVVTVKKFRRPKPIVLELENEELCENFKKQVDEIIRDNFFCLSDDQSWIDLMDFGATRDFVDI
ncbi:Rho/RAC guanine nucleotide exchange factor, putative [Entamoeba invadens IP1]|uniref:Rho/RAC guanine nucleotide exchange factor, putative n=1 Tax=Entamoeba invadens IP1 TaxID=370355 RepID=A0A0A1U8N9_ENTIV|nr:Rho/RAC guanine nucleotide exchange factor, putative [Entamoeba invadens IP1]ELP89448.1 Rho/RAC guanine nucleotide exchange factor, putative [Entamoeba invadens IP1]|eukprot:XP_004256219.1 Rho/RAC guanine nucleotide exchange factor, putative [Entamoeba invadens IP1]